MYLSNVPSSIPGEVGYFNFYSGTRCVSFMFCPCVISGGGSDIQQPQISGRPVHLYLSSVLIQSLCSSYGHLTHGHLDCKFRRGGVRPTLEEKTLQNKKQGKSTERGGSVVTHETRIREIPGSNPGADRPDSGFFRGFPQSSRQMLGWIFITTIHFTIIHPNSYIIKLKSVYLTNETLTTHNNRNTQPSGTHPKTLDAI